LLCHVGSIKKLKWNKDRQVQLINLDIRTQDHQ